MAIFPPLSLDDLKPTLATLQVYAQFIGKVRRALTPRQKHWSHVSLRVAVNGITTTPIPEDSITFELVLDLIAHGLVITTSRGEQWSESLEGLSAARLCEEGLSALAGFGINPEIDRSLFSDTTAGRYDAGIARQYFNALSQIDMVLKKYQGTLREETSPVQLWPHHVDLAMLWFSGRLVPGVDPADEENADEQMNFGFAPGDEGIPAPYFYITAYPMPDGLTDTRLPADAKWLTERFTGAVMMYEAIANADDPAEKLLDFFRIVQQAGVSFMRREV